MERTIQLVQPMKLAERKLLRVAAYARVSCDKDAMKHSLAAQISYYNEYIQRNPDWVFAGIYADEAYSGTKDDRPRFDLDQSLFFAHRRDPLIAVWKLLHRKNHRG